MAADRTEWRKNWCQRDALFGRTSLTEQRKDLSGILLAEWCQNLLIWAIFGLRDNNRQKCLSFFPWDVFVWVNNAAIVKTIDDWQRLTWLIQIALPCGSVLRLHVVGFDSNVRVLPMCFIQKSGFEKMIFYTEIPYNCKQLDSSSKLQRHSCCLQIKTKVTIARTFVDPCVSTRWKTWY